MLYSDKDWEFQRLASTWNTVKEALPYRVNMS